jgi:hypothetical protein
MESAFKIFATMARNVHGGQIPGNVPTTLVIQIYIRQRQRSVSEIQIAQISSKYRRCNRWIIDTQREYRTVKIDRAAAPQCHFSQLGMIELYKKSKLTITINNNQKFSTKERKKKIENNALLLHTIK